MSCAYANAFGAPGTGAHAPRLFGVAVVDVLITLAAAAGTSWWCSARAPASAATHGAVQLRDGDSDAEDGAALRPAAASASASALASRGAARASTDLSAGAAGAAGAELHDAEEEAPALRGGGGGGFSAAAAAVGFAAVQRPARAAWVARGRSVALHFAAWVALAETLHAAFGTQTAVIRALGGSRC